MSKIDPIALRDAFGCFMTGVTVVTICDANGTPIGFTANSFSSVSIDPPLLSVCPSKSMSSFELFEQCEYFHVSVLGQQQQEISNTFASPEEDRFANVAWHKDANGCPVIEGALANFSCRRWQSVAAGDHIILIGEVTDFSSREGLGLGYFQGGYFSLDMERKATEVQTNAHEAHSPLLVGALVEWRNGLIVASDEAASLSLPCISYEDEQPTFDVIKAYVESQFGVVVKVGSVYSVFEHENSRDFTIYYRVSIEDSLEPRLDGKYRHIDLHSIDAASLDSEAAQHMVERYISESGSGNHRLYIGSEKQGQTHQPQ